MGQKAGVWRQAGPTPTPNMRNLPAWLGPRFNARSLYRAGGDNTWLVVVLDFLSPVSTTRRHLGLVLISCSERHFFYSL